MESERFNRGWEKLKEIDGEAGKKVIESLKEISPDLGRFIIEYSFGDIYSRDGLDLKSKEIVVVAALTALGNARPQLKVHLNGALNTESSVDEQPWTYEYDKLLSAPRDSPALPVARAKSQLTGEYMPTISWGPNWDDDLGGSTETLADYSDRKSVV